MRVIDVRRSRPLKGDELDTNRPTSRIPFALNRVLVVGLTTCFIAVLALLIYYGLFLPTRH